MKKGLAGQTPATFIMGLHTFNVTSNRKFCGRPAKYDGKNLPDSLRGLPIRERRTMRDISESLNLPLTTTHRLINKDESGIRHHTNPMKSKLTEQNKLERIAYCLDNRDSTTGYFHENTDRIHVDEKWFYIDFASMHYYMVDDEEEAYRPVQHKSHIQKVMFLCAVARPRYDFQMRRVFDGKIGLWPFVKMAPAQRSSRHRARGTMEMKSVNVKKEVYLEMMLTKVFPVIKEKCPTSMKSRTIIIQQDNAPPHQLFVNENEQVQQSLQQLELIVKIQNQPANSPDLNILDLGFFNSLQSLQAKHRTKTTEELVTVMGKVFEDYPCKKMDHVFLTHMCVMNEIIEAGGGNNYKIPHMNKWQLELQGALPRSIRATTECSVLEL